MVEAAELLSSGRTMVLVMTAYGGKTEDQEVLRCSVVYLFARVQLCWQMIDDVNRGRKYLRELAARSVRLARNEPNDWLVTFRVSVLQVELSPSRHS